MQPQEREYFENDGVSLEVHHFEDHATYWIKGGVGFLEFKEEELCKLADLLDLYKKEEIEGKTTFLIGVYYASNAVIALALLTLAVILMTGAI